MRMATERKKGQRLNKFVNDYTVFDLETTDKNISYASQISMFDTFDWISETRKMLVELADELELPKGSLLLLDNKARLTDAITSYAVNIYEHEYPEIPNAKKDETRNSIVLRIEEKSSKDRKDEIEIIVGKTQYEALYKPTVNKITTRKSEEGFVRLRLDNDSPEIIDYIKENTKYRVKNYSSKERMFGCCSRFEECSDAKKCTHPNKLFATACHYRHNLDNGRIIFGKNKNVDENGYL